MKKVILSLFLFMLVFNNAFGQEIIENPDKPLSDNAGREIKLQEMFRITDEKGDFYFKMIVYSGNLKVAQDGTFFVSDIDQLLKFSPQGEFLKNVITVGQGPGEMSSRRYPHDFYVDLESIYLFDSRARKIVQTDFDGNLKKEFKLEFEGVSPLYSFCGLSEDGFVFVHQENIRFNLKTSGFYDLEMSVVLVSPDGTKADRIFTFPRKTFGAPSFGMEWAPFEILFSNDLQEVFVYYTCEYQMTHANLKEGRISKIFNRKYPRIKHETTEHEEENIKKYDAPKRKYENDITGLFLQQEQIWISTSTTDEEKGFLIDVFDKGGKYFDCFYISIPGSIKTVWDNCIFTIEKDIDENLQIVQYKIIE